MTGQDAVNVAEAFHETLDLDGVILTKLDGDARGGAALSVKEVVGRPIAFASIGEKLADFEPFHPDRMAGRILGMGDVLTLIEKAEQSYDQEVAAKAAAKMQEGSLTLEDFLEQMQQIKKMGPLSGIVGMLPGIPKEVKNANISDKELGRVEAIIHSMTLTERRRPFTDQRFEAPPDRRRQRDLHLGGQPAAQAVQRDAADDEAVLRRARNRPKAQQEEEEAGSLRRPDRERASTWQSSSVSCGWARRSSRPTGWWRRTAARPATGGSSRSSGPTSRGQSHR